MLASGVRGPHGADEVTMPAGGQLGSIVVATDFSEGARIALERVALLPIGVGARIEVLHVAEEGGTGGDVTPLLEQARHSLARALEAAGSGKHDVVVSTKRGKPHVEIARSAHHGKAELIVLGRHGKRGFRDRVLGTTAERVIRNGDVSALVVAKPAEAPYRRPLVAVDMSESSRLALELASRLQAGSMAKIDLLHVIALPAPSEPTEAGISPDLARLLADLQRNAHAELSAFLGGIRGEHREWNVMLLMGDPHDVILEEAKRRETDVLVLGTTGRTGLPHVLMGSVAEGVLRAAACDVLVARLPRADFELP